MHVFIFIVWCFDEYMYLPLLPPKFSITSLQKAVLAPFKSTSVSILVTTDLISVTIN